MVVEKKQQLVLDLEKITLDDWIFIEDLSIGGWEIADRPFSKTKGLLLRLGGDPEVIGSMNLDQALSAIMGVGGTVQDAAVNPQSGSDSDSGPEESDTDLPDGETS